MLSNVKRPHSFLLYQARMWLSTPQQCWVAPGAQITSILFSRGFCANQVPSGAYWYQGVFLTQRSVNPASVRILIEAASASRTVSFTDCMRFWALWTSISVACKGRGPLHHSVPDAAASPPGRPKPGVHCLSLPCSRHARAGHITGG